MSGVSFSDFRGINAHPGAQHGLAGSKNTLPWPNYAVIAGPTAAAPKDVNLAQVKFANSGLDLLNGRPKEIVI